MVNSLLLVLLGSTIALSAPAMALQNTAALQDPTKPLTGLSVMPVENTVPSAAMPITLHLQAIFSGGHNSAIIDGQRYQVGDTVQDYRLSAIQPSQVVLEGQGKPLTLTLFPSL